MPGKKIPPPVNWYSTPKERRHAKPIALTLSEEEREALEALAAEHDAAASRVVGAAILLLRSSKRAAKEIASAKDRVPVGRPKKLS